MDNFENVLEKIRHDQKCKLNCCIAIGPTGPTGAHDYFFNKTNRNYSFSKKYTPHKTVVYIFLFCFYNFF